MRKGMAVLVLLSMAACAKDKSYEAGGTTDTTADTSRSGINIGLKTDTVTVPTIGTVKDTIIVDKPVVNGKKQIEIKRPTVTRKP